jgi:hypothetical protein
MASMEALKVTDPANKVTDPALLAALARQGIDSDYVEFTRDYGKRVKGVSSPYAKFYRDLNSNKRFMVISQFPMADADGVAIEAVWNSEKGIYTSKNNLFSATVESTKLTLTIRNDQPDGSKAGATLTTCPQLYLDGVEQKAGKPALLSTDPMNENYANNVLQWDYGICKRRLRIIEGRLLGSWVFDENPNGEIRIKYNRSGSFKLKLGQYAVSDDEELIPKEQLESAGYPLTVGDSATFYPDAHAETSSVDGWVRRYAPNSTWSAIRDGSGEAADDSEAYLKLEIYAGTSSGYWSCLWRTAILFDTSSLPDGAVISAATLSVYGGIKNDAPGWAPTTNVYSSNPASNTQLAASDYNTFGATAFCDSAIAYASFNTGGYNDFALNAAGITAISKTGVTKLGLRFASYDVANAAPTWVNSGDSYVFPWSADKGTGYKPKLVVTYTTGEVKTSGDSGTGSESTGERQLGATEAGAGTEAALAVVAVISGDGGSGSEIGGLLKGLFSQDEGSGSDSIKILSSKAGHDLRLQSYQGQVSMPHKEVKL